MQLFHAIKSKTGWATLFVSLVCLLQSNVYAQSDQEIIGTARVCQQIAEMSARLACYDRILPPANETTAAAGRSNPSPRPAPATPTQTPAPSTAQTTAPAEQEERGGVSSVVPFFNQADEVMSEIVEVEVIDLRTARLTAADGTVFVLSNSTTVPRWPDTPFPVEVRRGAFGTIYLWLEESRQRIRVTAE